MAAVRSLGFILISFILFIRSASAYQQIEFVRELGETGKQAQHLFSAPRSLVVSGDHLIVADTDAHRIVVLDQTGKVLLSWGTKGNKPGQFKLPSGVAVDEEGRVFVADTGNHRIQVFDREGKWIRAFGSKGDAPREFNQPSGIAVLNNVVYVADTGNGRVQVLTSEGIFLAQLTVKTPKDEMKSPVAVAVDKQNVVYALDAGTNTVRVFNPQGQQVLAFGSRGNGSSGFERPQGISLDVRGNIYVADTGNYKVKKFEKSGKLVAMTGTEGDGPGRFREVSGLFIDPETRIWAIDAEKGTIQVFSTERESGPAIAQASPPPSVVLSKELGDEVTAVAINKRPWGIKGDSLATLGIQGGRTIGSRGKEPALFRAPHGLTVDAGGNFWVADTDNDRLQKFSIEGNLLQVIGKYGSGEGEFKSPAAVAVGPKGSLCVADAGNKRVQVFSPKGMFLGSFGKAGKLAGQFNELADLAVDGAENIYVADRGNDRIAKYDNSGNLIWEAGKTGKLDGEFRQPVNIRVSPDNEVYVLDAGNSRVQVFNASGKFLRKFGSEGSDPGQFKEPAGLALEDGIRLYVGDRGNKRVQAFLLKHTPAVPQELTAQAKINEVQLSWKPNTETFLELYKIYRAESAADAFALVGTSTTPFYLDKNLPSNRSFLYRVSSQAREGNESGRTDLVSAVTPKLVPATPKRLRVDAQEKQITLSWLPNLESFVNHYRVYRTKQVSAGFELAAKTDRPIMTDGPLVDETLYYYQVTAVGKEGDESAPTEVVFAQTPKASLTEPPLEIAKVELGEVFASAYKYYESHPLGKVVIANNTDTPYQKVKLSFAIKEFMDFPTELEIPEIGAKQQLEFPLMPLFNNKILEVTENTPLQSEVSLVVFMNGEAKTLKRSFPLTLYERHAMRWDQKAKLGAFVTHKDPVVADFSRMLVQQYVDAYPNLPQPIVYARGVYDALGVLGLKYIVDPSGPSSEMSESAAAVDYLQYPRDTLSRKSGDCDDLSILFAAAMEDLGIATAFVDVPGHVFVMFDTGVAEKDKKTLGFPEELLVSHQGTVWVPVEMTIVGASFTRAWHKGAEEYRDWSAKKKVEVIPVETAWDSFKPVTLPKSEMTVKVKREDIEAAYKDELYALGRERLANLSAEFRETLKTNPGDRTALGQLGILYGENGLYAEALEQFQKLLALDAANAMAHNNIGNINYLQGRLDDARQAYEAALKESPSDPGIMVNLARTALQAGRKEDAKKIFRDAMAIDPRVARQYPDLAAVLGK